MPTILALDTSTEACSCALLQEGRFNPIGRNTQGVQIMSLEEGDTLAAIVCVPKEEREDDENGSEAVETES